MGNTVVYTAIFGAQDELNAPPPITDVDYVCFTDRALSAPGWNVIRVGPSPLPDRLAAKAPKAVPHKWVRRWP